MADSRYDTFPIAVDANKLMAKLEVKVLWKLIISSNTMDDNNKVKNNVLIWKDNFHFDWMGFKSHCTQMCDKSQP